MPWQKAHFNIFVFIYYTGNGIAYKDWFSQIKIKEATRKYKRNPIAIK